MAELREEIALELEILHDPGNLQVTVLDDEWEGEEYLDVKRMSDLSTKCKLRVKLQEAAAGEGGAPAPTDAGGVQAGMQAENQALRATSAEMQAENHALRATSAEQAGMQAEMQAEIQVLRAELAAERAKTEATRHAELAAHKTPAVPAANLRTASISGGGSLRSLCPAQQLVHGHLAYVLAARVAEKGYEELGGGGGGGSGSGGGGAQELIDAKTEAPVALSGSISEAKYQAVVPQIEQAATAAGVAALLASARGGCGGGGGGGGVRAVGWMNRWRLLAMLEDDTCRGHAFLGWSGPGWNACQKSVCGRCELATMRHD
jgi:hypothetical protein